MDPFSIMNRLVLKMKMHQLKIPVVYQCAILVTLLKRHNIESKIAVGFIVYGDTSCKHYWVEVENKKLDIATQLGMKYSPELAHLPIRLEVSLPENIKRVDLEQENMGVAIESDSHYEFYTTDPKEFWNQRPVSMRSFKF